jgi:hypothetical protein
VFESSREIDDYLARLAGRLQLETETLAGCAAWRVDGV